MPQSPKEYYLPTHLLEPFFQDKGVELLVEDQPFQPLKTYLEGRLHLVVFGDGLCSLSVQYVADGSPAVASASFVVRQDMLDRLKWDAPNKRFSLVCKKYEIV
jgi:hypothetical protein